MKIVRLVLLLSISGAAAACNGNAVTDPRGTGPVAPIFDQNSTSDTTATRDGGGAFGSGG